MNQSFSKYVGECVALVDEEIIASGKTRLEAYQKARALFPKKLITLTYVPKKRETLTFL